MPKQIVVTLNKIAEFAYADSHRRKMIVQQHKKPSNGGFQSMVYHEAENWLPGYIDSGFDSTHLQKRLLSLQQLYASTKGSNTGPDSGYLKGLNNGINALSWLTQMQSFVLSPDLYFQSCDQFASDGILIGNVLVKARPNGLVIRHKGKEVRVGAIKFHFSKSGRLSDESGELAAVTLYEYLKQCSTIPGQALHSLCYSIDAYRDSTHIAPKNYVRKHKDLIDACLEYELLWDSLP